MCLRVTYMKKYEEIFILFCILKVSEERSQSFSVEFLTLLIAQNRRVLQDGTDILTFHVGEAGESVSREQPQQEGFKVKLFNSFFISF
jgi:hypothetical protein